MVQHAQAVLEPRKTPVQARSVASVDAILEATLQVLLQSRQGAADDDSSGGTRRRVGWDPLSIFPNKSALLQAALRRHMVEVAEAVEVACKEQSGAALQPMATALISAFLTAKMKNAKTSVALYSVSSDVDGAKIVQQMGTRINHAILRMLATSSESLTTDPQLVASILQGMMAGVSRRILESSAPEKQFESLRQELIVAACAYLDACSTRDAIRDAAGRR